MCARGPAEAAGRRAGAGARNEASLRRGRWRRGGKGCSYYSALSEIPVVRKRAVVRLREVRRLPRAVYRLQRDAIWPALVDGLLSLQVRQTANSWGEPNEEWTMNGGVRWGQDTPVTYEPYMDAPTVCEAVSSLRLGR